MDLAVNVDGDNILFVSLGTNVVVEVSKVETALVGASIVVVEAVIQAEVEIARKFLRLQVAVANAIF
jgi:hypothetical protein